MNGMTCKTSLFLCENMVNQKTIDKPQIAVNNIIKGTKIIFHEMERS